MSDTPRCCDGWRLFVRFPCVAQSYGCAVGRTYLVDPTSKQKKAYQSLLDVQQWVIDSIKPGEKVGLSFRLCSE